MKETTLNKRIYNKFKWYYYVLIQSIKKFHPYVTLKLIKRYRNQIVFIDESNFFVNSLTHHDLYYSKKNNGYFFDFHELRKFLSNHAEKTGIAIDVGANLGGVTYLLSKKFDKVIAFEPSNSTFESLRKNIEINKINNVVIEKIACSNKNGTEQLFKNHYHGHSSFVKKPNLKCQELVKTIRLDDYLNMNHITELEFLKVDVEGHELSVLLGLGEFLNPKKVKTIVFEHIQSAREYSVQSRELFDLLSQKGYNLFDFKGNVLSEKEIRSTGTLDILAMRDFII